MLNTLLDDQDDDTHSSTGSKQSDDDNCSFISHSHRSCNRYTPCNQHRHRYQSIDSSFLSPIKGSIRIVDELSGHRHRYDGSRWRRICDIPSCSRCLRGKIFYDNWLCREHYVIKSRNTSSSESQELITLDEDDNDTKNNNNNHHQVDPNEGISKNDESHQHRKTSARQLSKKKLPQPKRGEIIVGENGSRQKYDGHLWRPVCTNAACPRIARKLGFCHLHSISVRKRSPKRAVTPPQSATVSNPPVVAVPVPSPTPQIPIVLRVPSPPRVPAALRVPSTPRASVAFPVPPPQITVPLRVPSTPRASVAFPVPPPQITVPLRIPSPPQVLAAPVVQTVSSPAPMSPSVVSQAAPRSRSPDVSSLKRGDIQLVRQQWNGTKWYSLCHHPTEECSRRSAGIKYHHLCHPHYKEYLNQLKNSDRDKDSSSKNKRKRGRPPSTIKTKSSIFFDGSKASITSVTKSTNDQIGHNERIIQTEVTYSLTATDLRDACIFVDDDAFDDDRSKSFETGDIKHELTDRDASN